MKLRIGSRESRLAVVQAEILMVAVRAVHPDWELELVTMKTTGDQILDQPLDSVGGKDLFIRELEEALEKRQIDVAIHSCKDLPVEENPAFPIAAYSRREDARDVLVLPPGMKELDLSKPVGCSSLRRMGQLKLLYPEAEIVPVRGNVQTRLRKLDEGQFSALVLAGAGLKRLGLEDRIFRWFTVEEMMPAAGQGVLAAQTRAGEDVSYLLEGFADRESAACVQAERAFIRALGGGCGSPAAAYAMADGEWLMLAGMNANGEKSVMAGMVDEAAAVGEQLGRELGGHLWLLRKDV